MMITIGIIAYLLLGRIYYSTTMKLSGLPTECVDFDDYAFKGGAVLLWPLLFLADLLKAFFAVVGKIIP